jgi:hypothetical protein
MDEMNQSMGKAKIFEEIYRDYLDKVLNLDRFRVRDRLGVQIRDTDIIIPFYGVMYRIRSEGIIDGQGRRPSHSVSVILCKYLLLCPENEPREADWVTYKDFKDATPFAEGFLNNAQRPISRHFAGRLEDLRKACAELTGRPFQAEISADLVMKFDALPKVPVLLVFNDRDEDFPAHCSLLFEKRAEKFLDMECLAMAGCELSEWLKQRSSKY